MFRRLFPIVLAVALLGVTLLPAQVFGAPPEVTDAADVNLNEPIMHTRVCGASGSGMARCHARLRTDRRVKGKIPTRVAVPDVATVGNGGAYDPSWLRSAYNLPNA